MNRVHAALVCLATTGCLTVTANAGAQEGANNPLSFDFNLAAVHQSETDLKDTPGAFTMDRWFASAGINYSWDPRHAIGLTVGGGTSSYEFSGVPTIGGYNPWSDVDEFRLSATARFRITDRVSGFVIPSVRENGEAGASSSDARTWGVYAAAAWWIDESLTIGPGLGVFSRLDRGTQVFPVLVVDWDINDRWNLSTGRGLAASRGPGLNLSYRANDFWTFSLAGRYEDLEFRLDQSGSAAGGVGRHQAFPLVVMATLNPSASGSVSVFLGAELGGKLTLRNADRETVSSSEYDPALTAGAALNFRF